MRQSYSQLAFLFCSILSGAPPAIQDSPAMPAIAAKEPDVAANSDELISYRFHLGPEHAQYSLVAINPSGAPGRFYSKGLTAETEGRAASVEPTILQPGAMVRLAPSEIKWADYQCVYVEAPRRVQIRLAAAGDTTGAPIPLHTRETLYDIVGEQRLDSVSTADSDRVVLLLHDPSTSRAVVKAGDDLRPHARGLSRRAGSRESALYVVITLQPRSAEAAK